MALTEHDADIIATIIADAYVRAESIAKRHGADTMSTTHPFNNSAYGIQLIEDAVYGFIDENYTREFEKRIATERERIARVRGGSTSPLIHRGIIDE